jgi:hypothetical protein
MNKVFVCHNDTAKLCIYTTDIQGCSAFGILHLTFASFPPKLMDILNNLVQAVCTRSMSAGNISSVCVYRTRR